MQSRQCLCVLASLAILIISTAVLVFLFLKSQEPTSAVSGIDKSTSRKSPTYAAKYKHAAVSADARQCASIGVDFLRQNGTAVDAAIAVLFCMGLVTPESTGIGGGSFMMVYNASDGKVFALSGRESAPAYAFDGMFDDELAIKTEKSQVGVDAIAVPGDLALYHQAHEMFGRINFPDLMTPTIDLAEEGFEVGFHLGNAIKQREERFARFNVTNLINLLTNNETGEYFREGDMMKRADLAKTLRIIQREGINSMYSENGTIAKMLIKDLREQGSSMTIDDLVGFKVQVEEMSSRELANGMNFYSTALPGSGPLLGFMMDTLMRTFDVSKGSERKLTGADIDVFNQRITEVFKFAYGQRTFLEDPDFPTNLTHGWNTTASASARLMDKEYAGFIARKILSMNATGNSPSFYQFQDEYEGYKGDSGTAGLTVVDAAGNVVAVGGTVNAYFGSYIISPSTGIILNNEMDDFSANVTNLYGVRPGEHNHVAPGKRPFSSIAPCIITDADGGFVLSMGASGGTQITTSEALVALRTLLFQDISLETAIKEPRIHHQLQPNELKFENEPEATVPEERLQPLRDFGHNVTAITGRGSIVMAIKKTEDGLLETVTDWRKGGAVDGY